MPDYWQKACELEAANQLDAAIETLRTEMLGESARHWECQTSHLFSLRAHRLARLGALAEAKLAAISAIYWIEKYAASADNIGDAKNFSAQVRELKIELKNYL